MLKNLPWEVSSYAIASMMELFTIDRKFFQLECTLSNLSEILNLQLDCLSEETNLPKTT